MGTTDVADEPPPIPDDVVLSCGCFIHCDVVDGVNRLTLSACKPGCRVIALTMEAGDERGVPIQTVIE
jgi:hypothetical protein